MIRVIRARDRHFNDFDWLQTFWLFSFADYYDTANLQFGALRVLNDDVVQPGMGFPTHPHREMEIITVPLVGEMTHADSMGNRAVIRAGDVQRMSAGTGLTHSEFNLARKPVHFYQIWIFPDRAELKPTYDQRSFFHPDWLPVIGLVVFGSFFGQIKSVVLGYGLFRIASDVEKLPFPMAPIGAQGIMALAEDADDKQQASTEKSWRWRVFAIGGAMGLAFGAIYLLLPALSGALTGKPVQILPIPFVDWTPKTQHYLKAVATGLSWDLGNLIVGMVLPFWAMVGSFIGLIITFVMNPLLYHFEVLKSWQPGDGTIPTLFKNNIDFYFSFGIGISVAVFLGGLWQVVRSLRKPPAPVVQGPSRAVVTLRERGDIPTWLIVTSYFGITLTYILVCGWLINWHRGVMWVLFLLGFVYTPIISYVTARLEGIAGQVVEIPMIREASLILSGYKGVAVWFLPIPIANYGTMTLHYRKCELLGTKFTSLWKAQFFLYPIILISSILFANFIWGLAEIPSAVYPYALKMWELNAANQCIMFSATMGEYTVFEEAFSWTKLFAGTGAGVLLFGVLNQVGAPIFLVYGVVRGLGQSTPHGILPQFLGALLGQFYFKRKFGDRWRQYIPVVSAGFFCGQGLITILGVGITFLSKAVIQLPF